MTGKTLLVWDCLYMHLYYDVDVCIFIFVLYDNNYLVTLAGRKLGTTRYVPRERLLREIQQFTVYNNIQSNQSKC